MTTKLYCDVLRGLLPLASEGLSNRESDAKNGVEDAQQDFDDGARAYAAAEQLLANGPGPLSRLNKAAPKLLKVCERLLDALPELNDPDEECNGGDAVQVLSDIWPSLRAAVRQARPGKGKANNER